MQRTRREAFPEFQKAIKAFPGYYEAYVKLGAAELDLKQWDAAESAFRKSVELSGGRYAPANFGLGLILATVTKQFTQAEAIVRAGLELEPTDVTGNFVLDWVLYSTDRLEEAEGSASEAILSGPNFAGPRLLLAQIHLRENQYSAVVEEAGSAGGGTPAPHLLDTSIANAIAKAKMAICKERPKLAPRV